jgi:hypothetical protein
MTTGCTSSDFQWVGCLVCRFFFFKPYQLQSMCENNYEKMVERNGNKLVLLHYLSEGTVNHERVQL